MSAFMILTGVLFVFLGVREFKEKFPLLKSSLITAVLALLIVNFSVPGYWVATYNVDRFLKGDLSALDTEYLVRASSDSILVLLDRKQELQDRRDDSLNEDLDGVAKYIDNHYLDKDQYYCVINDSWKSFNISSYRVQAKYLEDDAR